MSISHSESLTTLESTTSPPTVEGSFDSSVDGTGTSGLSASILAAQAEADKLADEQEAAEGDAGKASDESAPLPAVPRLLGGDNVKNEEVKEKANEMKNKGAQLDLLLLKAESYRYVSPLYLLCASGVLASIYLFLLCRHFSYSYSIYMYVY